jgi:hypothetical protein
MEFDMASINFEPSGARHPVDAKFVQAFLTGSGKYNARVAKPTALDIHDVASMGERFNIHTSSEVIEAGATAFFNILKELAPEGYTFKTPVFELCMSIPGEFSGAETSLPADIKPRGNIRTTKSFRKHLAENTAVRFVGHVSTKEGIESVLDKASGLVNELLSPGHIVEISGRGLAIKAPEEQNEAAGLFLEDEEGALTRIEEISSYTPCLVTALIPPGLDTAKRYRIVIRTHSSPVHGATLRKDLREVVSASLAVAA